MIELCICLANIDILEVPSNNDDFNIFLILVFGDAIGHNKIPIPCEIEQTNINSNNQRSFKAIPNNEVMQSKTDVVIPANISRVI
jgi:hypothetical protein